LGLGANTGDALRTLRDAASILSRLLIGARVAPIYRSQPIGPPQADFLNTAVVGETARPRDLLACCA
jgi:2-amino-4-hydroxy-6-hydroxymethyldihydropteridine diphosphokinase